MNPLITFDLFHKSRTANYAPNMSADNELASILNRRQQINEGDETVQPRFKVVNVYTEFHELTRKQIKDYQVTFNR